MAPVSVRAQGPWWHRFLLRSCTVGLGVLLYLALSFLIDDLWALNAVDAQPVIDKYVSAETLQESQQVARQLTQADRDLGRQKEEIRLQDVNAEEAGKSYDQARKFLTDAANENRAASAEVVALVAESQALFLKANNELVALRSRLAEATAARHELQTRRDALDAELNTQRQQGYQELARLEEARRMWVGLWQLLTLTPLLVLAAVGLAKLWHSPYVVFVQALSGAVFFKVFLVLSSYFSGIVFRYALVGVAILVVAALLRGLVRLIVHPRRDWLLKQYRDAYEAFFCPVCDFPIRRGPLKFLYWNRRTIKNLQFPHTTAAVPDEPYTCPHCGTTLFEECTQCHHIRHALLPACEACGCQHEVAGEVA